MRGKEPGGKNEMCSVTEYAGGKASAKASS